RPALTGTGLDAATIKRLAVDHPNVRCVKVESEPPGRLIGELAAEPVSLPSFVGYVGVQLPDALARGAVGVQPGLFLRRDLPADLGALGARRRGGGAGVAWPPASVRLVLDAARGADRGRGEGDLGRARMVRLGPVP
ncbi:MAG: hypothetical protein ACRDN9_16645, partial [Streptosporangiaceae bacterium]